MQFIMERRTQVLLMRRLWLDFPLKEREKRQHVVVWSGWTDCSKKKSGKFNALRVGFQVDSDF
jgi:hypothetical protein